MTLPFPHGEPDAVAIIESSTGRTFTYGELDELIEQRAAEIDHSNGVALLLCVNEVATIVDYLAALRRGLAVLPLDAATELRTLAEITERYRPDVILGDSSTVKFDGYAISATRLQVRDGSSIAVCADLAILLSTSGSTGSPRMVRLTRGNIAANTRSIIESLSITAADRAITSMPFHYSYGLSVVNTHLAAGASLVVSGASVLEPEFWNAVRLHGVTTIAGVPYTFAMLTRLRFDPTSTPSVQKVMQAGGKLDLDSTRRFYELFSSAGIAFYIMYGQTEAGPRISCLPAERLGDKLGSAGLPMSGGALFIDEVDSVVPARTRGEVIYVGPNVMLGYATARAELTCSNDANGVLRTGDLGYLDDEGFLFITGRIKRITKLFGSRVSLDEVEAHLAELGPVAAVGGGEERLHVHHQNNDDEVVDRARKSLSRELKVPLASILMHFENEFPLMPSGKVDYRELTTRHEAVES